jgi:hypothetical protein
MTTKLLDVSAVATLVRELLRDLPCEVSVETPDIIIQAPASDDANQRREVYARLLRRLVRRSRFSHGPGVPEGWQITNGAGYGQAETRTFTTDSPDPKKVAASLAEVVRRRAARFGAMAQERERHERATNLDIETTIKVAAILGFKRERDDAFSYTIEDAEKTVRPEHGTGRVVVHFKGFSGELRCWPEEVIDAMRALKGWQAQVNHFGQKREG